MAMLLPLLAPANQNELAMRYAQSMVPLVTHSLGYVTIVPMVILQLLLVPVCHNKNVIANASALVATLSAVIARNVLLAML